MGLEEEEQLIQNKIILLCSACPSDTEWKCCRALKREREMWQREGSRAGGANQSYQNTWAGRQTGRGGEGERAITFQTPWSPGIQWPCPESNLSSLAMLASSSICQDPCDELMVYFALLLLCYTECWKGENVNADIDYYKKYRFLKGEAIEATMGIFRHCQSGTSSISLTHCSWIGKMYILLGGERIKYSFRPDNVLGNALSNLQILAYLKLVRPVWVSGWAST